MNSLQCQWQLRNEFQGCNCGVHAGVAARRILERGTDR
jgi:hypothetical protein